MTTTHDDELRHNLDDVVHDMLNEVFCGDCEHPRCTNKVKTYKAAIESIIEARELAAQTSVLEKLIEKPHTYPIHGGTDSLYPSMKVQAVPIAKIKETLTDLKSQQQENEG